MRIELTIILLHKSRVPCDNPTRLCARHCGLECFLHGSSAWWEGTERYKARIKEIIDAVPAEHKDWLNEKLRFSHEMSLSDRLKDILSLTKGTISPLIGDSDDFAIKVKNIRNYLTHYSDKNQINLYEGDTLFRINQVLDFMIKHCLLNEIGCSHERCTELISCKENYRYLKSSKFFSKS
ncbi:MAG: hypothetical protein HC907_18215 [Richelia sp. SM1_7_0]|nr:hypothetical protein [Richelia sp. SM1_7_0]